MSADDRFTATVGRAQAHTVPVVFHGSVVQVVRGWLDSMTNLLGTLDEQAGANLDSELAEIEPEDVAYILGRDGRYEITVTIDPDLGPTTFALIDNHHAPF